MRQGHQHRRGRGRSNQSNNNNNGHRKGGQNPLTRSFDSNGPDVKVRGTPAHIAEKYMQLARDAQSSGDPVLAENYLQHAEHYNRIILAYREQQAPQQGEAMNGSHRGFGHRQEPLSPDEIGDEFSAEDGVAGEQPGVGRHSSEQPRAMDSQPGFDESRQQRQHDHNPRYRDRHARHGHERHERHERSDQRERPEGYERPDRGERGFDRHRDRSHQQPRDSDQPSVELRDHRPAHRDAPEAPRDREVVQAESHPAPPPTTEPATGERADQPSRRRERFGMGGDQPDFLRRPIRRPRREPEPGFAAEGQPPAAEDTTTPRE
jgi:hypothetical protein